MFEEGRNYEDAMDAYRHAAHFYTAEMMTQQVSGRRDSQPTSMGRGWKPRE
jgi:hypothetical protein